MRLYHGCGHPILAIPLSNPFSREHLFFDGESDPEKLRTTGEIKRCPGCGVTLYYVDLRETPNAATGEAAG
jgi:hypothetical protein